MVFKRYNIETQKEYYIVVLISYSFNFPIDNNSNDNDDEYDAYCYEYSETVIQANVQYFQDCHSIKENIDKTFNLTKDLVEFIYNECLTSKPNGKLSRIEIIDFLSKPLDTPLVYKLVEPSSPLKEYENTIKKYFKLKEQYGKILELLNMNNILIDLKELKKSQFPDDTIDYEVITLIIRYMTAKDIYSGHKNTGQFDDKIVTISFLNNHIGSKLTREMFINHLNRLTKETHPNICLKPKIQFHELKVARASKMMHYLENWDTKSNDEFVKNELLKYNLKPSNNLFDAIEKSSIKIDFLKIETEYKNQFKENQKLQKLFFEKHCTPKSKLPQRN